MTSTKTIKYHRSIERGHAYTTTSLFHSQALDSVSKGQRKLDLAQRLTGALSSENDRWAENVVQLRADMELLTGDVLLAASFIR